VNPRRLHWLLACCALAAPVPGVAAEAKVSWPARLFANAMSSGTEAAGTDGWTIRMLGTATPSVIAAKSRSGS